MAQHILDLDQPSPHKSPQKAVNSPKSTSKNKKPQSSAKLGWTKRRKAFLIIGSSFLVLALILLVIWQFQPSQPAPQTASPTPTPTPTPVPADQPNPLNGTLYTKEQAQSWSNRRPLAVMIENHPESRPQSGLDQAEVIYEGMAEGGITRMMAMYLHNMPNKIGPVRSARMHFVSWASEYDALYAHWGGSAESLQYLRSNSRPRDIDQFRHPAAFYRDYSGGKSLEHTGYTSAEALRRISSQNNWEQLSTFRSWQFKDDLPSSQRPQAQQVDLSLLGQSSYTIRYVYQPQSNAYLRYTGGQPHRDASGQHLVAKTIILQFQSVNSFIDQSGHPAVHVDTIGSGKAVVIQDGQAISGTWSKSANTTRTTYNDTHGQEIPLNRGLIWVISVPSGTGYSY